MSNNAIRFACNGCGVCCKGRLIPLTLSESRTWLARGHDVAVLLEAFDEFNWPEEPAKLLNSVRRAVEVDSGSHRIKVIPIFAANALAHCPNLDSQNRCGIYSERPLVCRIYPLEISPFIGLNPADNICPPEVWEAGDIIFTDRITDPVIAEYVDQSRRSDRADARAKVAICGSLGMTVTAWKGDAFTVYFPSRDELATAIEHIDLGRSQPTQLNWRVRIDDIDLRKTVSGRGAQIDVNDSPLIFFIKLRSPSLAQFRHFRFSNIPKYTGRGAGASTKARHFVQFFAFIRQPVCCPSRS